MMHHASGIPDYTGLLQIEGYRYRDRTTQAQALQALAGLNQPPLFDQNRRHAAGNREKRWEWALARPLAGG
jgi:hypothetical protein